MHTEEMNYPDIARRYLLSSSFTNFTLRNIPNTLFGNESVQKFIDSVASNTTNTYNRSETISKIFMAMNKLPYDPNGVDAQITLSTYSKYTA
jgi:hypothetical protein